MTNTAQDQPQNILIYLRNHLKIAKKVFVKANVNSEELYQLASDRFLLPKDHIHLYFSGERVQHDQQIALEDKSIVHVVNLDNLKMERIEVVVRKMGQARVQKIFQIRTDLKIQNFIDEQLEEWFGTCSSTSYLVNMGRQLDKQKTFKDYQIQNKSELICVHNEPQPVEHKVARMRSYPSAEKNSTGMNINIKDSEDSHKHKDIYPIPNFTIEVPTELHTTNNKLNLIFDAKVRKSSSIMDIDFSPDDIIQEEQGGENDLSVKSQKYSEEQKPSSIHSFQSQKAKAKSSGLDGVQKSRNVSDGQVKEGNRVDGNMLIYTEDVNGVNGRGMMNDLINELNNKSRTGDNIENKE